MKYIKSITNPFTRSPKNSKLLALGLIGGLALGAMITMLFTTKSGKELRKQIGDDVANSKANNASLEGDGVQTNHLAAQGLNRKPKSDIKELRQETHGSAHTEQGI